MTHFSKPVILINLSSSSAQDISQDFEALFQRYGHAVPTVLTGTSADMADLLKQMRQAKGDLLVSYGGDGTAAAVASIAREQSVPFLPLPGGTMNVLMKGLYGTDSWKDCLLRGLATAGPRPMTAGCVIDRHGQEYPFLVAAILGAATHMSEAREAFREGLFLDALKGIFETLRRADSGAPLHVDFGGKTHNVELLDATCPFMNGSALDPEQFHLTLVRTLSGEATLSLGVAAVTGEFKDSQSVKSQLVAEFTVSSEEQIDALLDGEPHKFEGPITLKLNPTCGTVLAPRPALSFPKPRVASKDETAE